MKDGTSVQKIAMVFICHFALTFGEMSLGSLPKEVIKLKQLCKQHKTLYDNLF